MARTDWGSVDELVAVFHRAAAGRGTPGDAQAVAGVLKDAAKGNATQEALLDAAAHRLAGALGGAIQAGSPCRATLQAFLDLLEAGHLSPGPVAYFVPNPEARPGLVALAQETLRRIWPALGGLPEGFQGTFTVPPAKPK